MPNCLKHGNPEPCHECQQQALPEWRRRPNPNNYPRPMPQQHAPSPSIRNSSSNDNSPARADASPNWRSKAPRSFDSKPCVRYKGTVSKADASQSWRASSDSKAEVDPDNNNSSSSARRVPVPLPAQGHNHGNKRPCKIRCGINEGLCVENHQGHVTHLFTDGLVGCTQVIFRSATTSFTCHIKDGAPNPVPWIQWALKQFERLHGKVEHCYVATGDGSGSAAGAVNAALGERGSKLLAKAGGYFIVPKTGEIGRVGIKGWAVTGQEVAGWQTATGLIVLRLPGTASLGEVQVGDYSEACPVCRALPSI